MATPQDAKPSSLKQYYVAVGTLDAKLVRRIASGRPRSWGQATLSLQQACGTTAGAQGQYSPACPPLLFMQATLLDLLKAFESAAPLGLVVCCG